ncbi:MAG: methyltransferase domain-containing protein [Candidatus Paceibacterota bacterium]
MAFSNPETLVAQFPIDEGFKVADIGAGVGFYAIPLAKKVGRIGRVFAIDVQKEILTRLKNEATRQKINNVEILWGDAEKIGGTSLRDGAVDVVVVVNTLFQIEHREDFAKEINRILKIKGKLCFVDWESSFGGMGPSQDSIVSRDEAEELFKKNGLEVINYVNDPGEYHYGIIFKKK